METIKAKSHFVRIMRNPITADETTEDMNTPLGGQATAFLECCRHFGERLGHFQRYPGVAAFEQSAFRSPLQARRYVMKTITLAALAVIGAGLAASSTSAAPINPGLAGISAVPSSNVIQVDKKWMGNNWKWRHRHHHDNDFRFGLGFGVPFFALGVGPYYYNRHVDCIGWWHRHYSGRLHCHGQLVYD
jgi:hypothetical protein